VLAAAWVPLALAAAAAAGGGPPGGDPPPPLAPAATTMTFVGKLKSGPESARIGLVSDGQAADIFPIVNSVFNGRPNDSDWLISFRLVDRFGVPLAGVPVVFTAESGGGSIACSNPAGCADAATDITGKAGALVTLGPNTGEQVFAAAAGGLTVRFYAEVQ
jgi:hypothetical protein